MGSSPRPWGCFSSTSCRFSMTGVFPTPVGVFLSRLSASRSFSSLPHARGGVSALQRNRNGIPRSSPRPWGCFYRSPCQISPSQVFPTPVGVFLTQITRFYFCCCLPHARGGVSLYRWCRKTTPESSPRPWGCFLRIRTAGSPGLVFPTPVGVFLDDPDHEIPMGRLPHARGGVSGKEIEKWQPDSSSPRPWGCFHRKSFCRTPRRVFPTPVGVFLA